MTTIAAYICPKTGATAIASDRMMCYGATKYELLRSKVIPVGEWLVGVAGAAQAITVLSNLQPRGDWSAQDIADVVIDEMRERGQMEDGGMPVDLLIVRHGEIWIAGADGGAHPVGNYAATGSGMEYALGWMAEAWRVKGMGAECAASTAVCAASRHDPFTGDEIDVVLASTP